MSGIPPPPKEIADLIVLFQRMMVAHILGREVSPDEEAFDVGIAHKGKVLEVLSALAVCGASTAELAHDLQATSDEVAASALLGSLYGQQMAYIEGGISVERYEAKKKGRVA